MLNPMPVAVRVRLADILAERGMKQKELAEKVKLSENAVSKLVTGRPRQIRLDTIERLCESLEIMPGELFEMEKVG